MKKQKATAPGRTATGTTSKATERDPTLRMEARRTVRRLPLFC